MDAVRQQGFFSLLRWRVDPSRDEARNVAILLVVPDAHAGLVRSAPLNSISPRLHDQGIVDDLLAGLEQMFADPAAASLDVLSDLHQRFQRSLVVTEPRPVAVADLDADVASLYRAYLAQRSGGGSRAQTKGQVRDRITKELRARGVDAKLGQYVDDFLFDIVIHNGHPEPMVLEVLSFAGARKDWTPVEFDAGHFLFGCRHVHAEGRAVLVPPADDERALASFERVQRWLGQESVPTVTADEMLESPQQALELEESATA